MLQATLNKMRSSAVTLIIMSLPLCFLPEKAFGFVSVAYRGGLHSGAPSTGAVLDIRPVKKYSLAFSYNYASIDVSNTVEQVSDGWSVFHGTSNFDVTKAQIKRYSKELQLRIYPKEDSFFFAIGAMQQTGTGHFAAKLKDGSEFTEKKYSTTSTFGTLSLGNVWGSGFMIGFEWAGMTRRIDYDRKETETIAESSNDDLTKATSEFQSQLNNYCGEGGVSLLLLHLGLVL